MCAIKIATGNRKIPRRGYRFAAKHKQVFMLLRSCRIEGKHHNTFASLTNRNEYSDFASLRETASREGNQQQPEANCAQND
jgi:hypothetical protein